MSTIIVSPAARPRPIMTAEKPGAGGGQHDPGRRLPARGPQRQRAGPQGLGHTAQRVLGDGEDDRDEREPHRETGHERVALVVGQPERRPEPAPVVPAEGQALGASHRPATRPSTTLGSAAMNSTTGFTTPRRAGDVNSLT